MPTLTLPSPHPSGAQSAFPVQKTSVPMCAKLQFHRWLCLGQLTVKHQGDTSIKYLWKAWIWRRTSKLYLLGFTVFTDWFAFLFQVREIVSKLCIHLIYDILWNVLFIDIQRAVRWFEMGFLVNQKTPFPEYCIQTWHRLMYDNALPLARYITGKWWYIWFKCYIGQCG